MSDPRQNGDPQVPVPRYARIDQARRLGADLADLLLLCMPPDQAAGDWPSRTVANTIRLYPGVLQPGETLELERELRRGMKERWSILSGTDGGDDGSPPDAE